MVKAEENAIDLKPFYERASEAEERLSRLEAVVARKDESSSGNANSSTVVKELKMKLENMEAEIRSEQQKGQSLTTENEKLKYQMLHLRRSLDEAESEITNLRKDRPNGPNQDASNGEAQHRPVNMA
ncbi:hypothetical protein H6P81_012314 [Aristolochia fimbriata]|uniref:Uncharacterized protein n=1 Tax=Aristolochia fimbriata TaxID=158543 RepID=A0AAV7EE89_ARIFI|nr:hypothetical protein H6P81_012314 [Aristolochia fimbriata]